MLICIVSWIPGSWLGTEWATNPRRQSIGKSTEFPVDPLPLRLYLSHPLLYRRHISMASMLRNFM